MNSSTKCSNSSPTICKAAKETLALVIAFVSIVILMALVIKHEDSIQSFCYQAQLAVWYMLTFGMSVWGGVANATIAAAAFYFSTRVTSSLEGEKTPSAEIVCGKFILAAIASAIWYVLSLIALDNLQFDHGNIFQMTAIVAVHLPAPFAILFKMVD